MVSWPVSKREPPSDARPFGFSRVQQQQRDSKQSYSFSLRPAHYNNDETSLPSIDEFSIPSSFDIMEDSVSSITRDERTRRTGRTDQAHDLSREERSLYSTARDVEDGVEVERAPSNWLDEEPRRNVREGPRSAGGPRNAKRRQLNLMRYKSHMIYGGIALLLIVIIVVVAVVVSNAKSSDGEWYPTDRVEGLMGVFSTVSDVDALETPGTPQYRAKEWMLHTDPLQLTLSDAATEKRITQRYALAVFYFATGGPNWWDANNWMEGDECSGIFWTGLSCGEENQVRALALDNFGLTGSIPDEIGFLTDVENLVLKNNKELRGQIPPTIGKMSMLGQLGLYNNALVGGIPRELYEATNLNYINLQNNDLQGGLMMHVENLRYLERLILFNNNFIGAIPAQLAKTRIKFLGLSNNGFSGTIGEGIGELSNLQYLYLDGNDFGGVLPKALGRLQYLKSINLDGNKISGVIPSEVGNLGMLEYVSIQQNRLSGPLPTQISRLTRLHTLNLAANALTGRLPDISRMDQLIHLHLYENSLNGPLPESLFDAARLKVLFLSSNRLSGIIPSSISRLGATLEGLYLSDNSFEGSIPPSVCQIQKLRALFLDENRLTGELPACMGMLYDLRQLYVFDNKLSGDLPSGLAELTSLRGLGLEANNFGGTVSNGVCALRGFYLQDLWADCGGGSPEISCACCSICCPSPACTA